MVPISIGSQGYMRIECLAGSKNPYTQKYSFLYSYFSSDLNTCKRLQVGDSTENITLFLWRRVKKKRQHISTSSSSSHVEIKFLQLPMEMYTFILWGFLSIWEGVKWSDIIIKYTVELLFILFCQKKKHTLSIWLLLIYIIFQARGHHKMCVPTVFPWRNELGYWMCSLSFFTRQRLM